MFDSDLALIQTIIVGWINATYGLESTSSTQHITQRPGSHLAVVECQLFPMQTAFTQLGGTFPSHVTFVTSATARGR